MQCQEAVGQECVVDQIGVQLCLTLAVGSPQAAVVTPQLGQHEVCRRFSSLDKPRFLENRTGIGESADHQAIPTGEDFCIGQRAFASVSDFHQLGAKRFHFIV